MTAFLKFMAKASRAFYAAAVVFIASSSTALVGDQGFSDLNTYQICVIAGSSLAAFGGVWGFVNPTFSGEAQKAVTPKSGG